MDDRRVSLVLWLIDHHPESALHGYHAAAVLPPPFVPSPRNW
jgi:hypothetical protein